MLDNALPFGQVTLLNVTASGDAECRQVEHIVPKNALILPNVAHHFQSRLL